jgi:hypothetical protein
MPRVVQKTLSYMPCDKNMAMSSTLIDYINIDFGDVATEGNEEMILMGGKKSKWWEEREIEQSWYQIN